MMQMTCLLRRAPVALLILLLWLVAPSQNIQAASDGQHKPSAACTIHPPTGWRPYRILPGETLAAFAQEHGVTEERVRQVNCLTTTTIHANSILSSTCRSKSTWSSTFVILFCANSCSIIN